MGIKMMMKNHQKHSWVMEKPSFLYLEALF